MAENSVSYRQYLTLARDLAELGGRESLKYFGESLAIEEKADHTPVTVADRETERVMREFLAKHVPDHAIVGEEHGGRLGSGEWEWILDPIDGTKSFVRGVPLYTTLVALVHKGVPVAGVIFAPVTGEMAAAVAGGGCVDRNGRSLGVSACRSIADAWYVTTDPHDFSDRHPRAAETLIRSSASVRTWADAYGYMLLARGAVDVMVDPIMSPWDIAPLSVVVREAGGVFSNFAGLRDDLGSSAVAASTPELHAEVLAILTDGAGDNDGPDMRSH